MIKTVVKWLFIGVLIMLPVGCQQKGNDFHTADSSQEHLHVNQPQKTVRVKEVVTNLPMESLLPKLDSKRFIDEQIWLDSAKKDLVYEPEGEIIAAILPHHDVACDYLTSFYQTASKTKTEDPELILLISPNHEGDGPRFQIGAFDFVTHSGMVYSDGDSIHTLVEHPLMHEGITSVFEKEHGIGIHMNYIHRYFKEAKVIACIIGETRTHEGIEEVAEQLIASIQNKKVLLIASIDFSHYLTLEEANEKDAYTRQLILSSDTQAMSSLSNDYIDSPSSYGLLITLLQKLEEDYTCTIINHGNTATISGNLEMKETTSYFQVSYTRK